MLSDEAAGKPAQVLLQYETLYLGKNDETPAHEQ
jgi:hypothetical protein